MGAVDHGFARTQDAYMFGASWKLGSVAGVPIRMHWSAFLGALFFSGFRFAPGAWLGFFVVILIHELGHAFVVKRSRQRVLGVEIHAFGGHCQWAGNPSPIARAAIAWGGVWAQLALFVFALPLALLFGGSLGVYSAQFFNALTVTNLLLAAINLLPFKPLDGAEAWKLIPLWRQRRAEGRATIPQIRVAPQKQSATTNLPPELQQLFAKVAEDAREARAKRRN